MEQPVTIRAATLADVPAIQRVATETWRATYGGAIDDTDIEDFLASNYSQQAISASINRLGAGYLVAERGGSAIGYAMAGINREGRAELFAIYVLPEHQGSGAGHRLWNTAIDLLRGQGHPRVCCWVLSTNQRACDFYERQGAIMTEQRSFIIGASTVVEMRYCISLAASQ